MVECRRQQGGRNGANGLFKTTDGGDKWEHLAPEKIGGIEDYSIAICKSRPDTLYVLSLVPGKPGWTADKILFRTNDGGKTWERIDDGVIGETMKMAWIEVDPCNPRRLIYYAPYAVWIGYDPEAPNR